ncbi:MAG: glycosyltransferase [Chitinivibrionales bacterium]|nr:glycosyltransferase [Chitinivibrionales bacterium]
MKIVHIIADLPRGGAEHILLNLSREMIKKEPTMEIRVLTIFERGELAPAFEENNIPVDCTESSNCSLFTRLFRIIAYLLKQRPDVVHTHLNVADINGQLCALLCRIKTRIVTIHNMQVPESAKERFLNRIVSRLATTIVPVSQSVMHSCRAQGRIIPAKTRVIYNAPSFVMKRDGAVRRKPSGDIVKMVCIGNLYPVKGHVYAIRAVHQLKTRLGISVGLDIFGRDSDGYQQVLQNLIDSLGASDYIRLCGVTLQPEEELHRHDIFLMPSLSEGFGMAVVEAMSCGVPVVASNIPAHQEILDPDQYGIVVEIKDSGTFAAVLHTLIMDNRLYEKLSRNGLQRSQMFSLNAMVTGYQAVYTGKHLKKSGGKNSHS